MTHAAIDAELFAIRAQAAILGLTGYYNTGTMGKLPLPGTKAKLDALIQRWDHLIAAKRALLADA